MALPYGLAAVCQLDTWVSSEDTVIRWLPTIAADPACTGEQAASTAHALRPTAPSAATRRPFLAKVKRDTDDPFRQSRQQKTQHTHSYLRGAAPHPRAYDSDSTERTTSAHHASSSASRSGSPPKPPLEAPDFGTGISIVRTAGLSSVLGYSR